MRTFNTTGPVHSDEHYYLPPLERFDLTETSQLIEQKKYFVLHAPRQVGKTSYLLALMDHLNQLGEVQCLYVNVEAAQAAREDVGAAMHAILGQFAMRALNHLGDSYLLDQWQSILSQFGPFSALNVLLTMWAKESAKPLVLLLDEIDALIGDTLISVLRQLRSGYDQRPKFFPQSVILCGVRDVRDYRIYSSKDKEIITGGSAFNIKAKSLRMEEFSREEMERLYLQHTAETGQEFAPEALDLMWELTQGQPWLVNALGNETCFEISAGKIRSQIITADLVLQAKENIILRRETHLDQLVHKLEEPRVQRVISPMLQGTGMGDTVQEDDLKYVIDLGLVSRDRHGPRIANPIYREVIPRQLNIITQANLESQIEPLWYVLPDGRLDMEKLLTDFQQFFRENSEIWVERYRYQEAGPQLLMQAYLQRIINGGGRINREYGLGRGRTDLLVTWPVPSAAPQQVVIELKIRYGELDKIIASGLEQTWTYMDRCGTEDGHLVIFDRAKSRSWEEKIFKKVKQHEGHTITVWGM